MKTLSQMEKKRAIILNNDNDDTRRLFESCLSRGKHVCKPIVDWSDQQVWEYIQAEKIPMNPLYEMGFHWVGCVGCPMAGKQRYREFRIFPTYERAYRRAFAKMLELRKAAGRQCKSRLWSDVDAFFLWWMEDPGIPGQYELSFHEDTNEIYYDYL